MACADAATQGEDQFMADTIRFPGTGVRRAAALALLGAVLGLLGAKYVLVGSGWNLLPWGLVALLVGFTRARAAGRPSTLESTGSRSRSCS